VITLAIQLSVKGDALMVIETITRELTPTYPPLSSPPFFLQSVFSSFLRVQRTCCSKCTSWKGT